MADLPEIISYYMSKRRIALDQEAKTKPMMDNHCSKNHPLFNQTVIQNGKIILRPNNKAFHPSVQAQCKLKGQKFRMSEKSREVLRRMMNKESKYFENCDEKKMEGNEYGLESSGKNQDLKGERLGTTFADERSSKIFERFSNSKLFGSFEGGRPSRLIMREGHPQLPTDGNIKRQALADTSITIKKGPKGHLLSLKNLVNDIDFKNSSKGLISEKVRNNSCLSAQNTNEQIKKAKPKAGTSDHK